MKTSLPAARCPQWSHVVAAGFIGMTIGLLPAAEVRPSDPGVARGSISNAAPRRDIHGRIINAHDGCLEQFEGRFYLYGTAYGVAPLYSPNRRPDPGAHQTPDGPAEPLVCYSSANLIDWVFHGPILRDQPAGYCVRPHVVYNARTRKYVLWFNWAQAAQGKDGRYATATSDQPGGPFTIESTATRIAHAPLPVGDHGLLVDDDGTGYLIYVRINPGSSQRDERHHVSIDRLTPDYLRSTMENSGLLHEGKGCEAPALFKRGKLYYALFDRACSYCPQGSGAMVFTATSPLGPYVFRNNINRGDAGTPTVAAQQTHVATVVLGAGRKYLWLGDRWRSASIFGENFQYWSSPLTFGADGTIRPLRWEDNWSLDRLLERDVFAP